MSDLNSFPSYSIPSAEEFRQAFLRHVRYTLARPSAEALTPSEALKAVSLTVRDLLIDGMLQTDERYRAAKAKRLYYLSMEFLMGRALGDNLVNLQLIDLCRGVLDDFGIRVDDVLEREPDAGLGNGGLGRLAACFLESLATLGMPGSGYGIDYEYGLFKQEIANGYQREKPDRWKISGTPFHIERPMQALAIPLYGKTSHARDSRGNHKEGWVDFKIVVGIPHDMPVAGFGGHTVNHLRLFSARSSEDFDIEIFNRGDYIRAIEQKIASENISRVLYPSDSVMSGKELRLVQEYFLVACAVNDIVREYTSTHASFDAFPDQVTIQMNDTHPALAVAELMRVLVDDYEMDWDRAWEVTQSTLAYTNHTLLPEALEKWPIPLLEHVLPRHTQVIFGINHRFLREVTYHYPTDLEKMRRMSVIEEGYEKQVRMANLAIIGSHSVNGVSELHTSLLKQSLVADFAQMWPEKFNNKTNGVSPRRWLLKSNPRFAGLLTSTLGEGWIADLDVLRGLEQHAHDPGFQAQFRAVKHQNKAQLAAVVLDTTGEIVDPESLFDVQVKRIHEYKRQLLNVMRIIYDYLALAEDGVEPPAAKTYIFAGKAAPGYWAAKQIIKLINNVARVVNRDPKVADRIRVAFLPDYRVSLAETIMPAADLSEQISTAGMEASGTGNMKLSMGGALTLGTWDGANIEIAEEVGLDNIYIFGLRAEEIREMQANNAYHPREHYSRDERVRRVVDALASNRFCPDEPGLFGWIVDALLDRGDRYFHIADLPSYIDTSRRAENDFNNAPVWTHKAILNVARISKFSSDRTVLEYSRDIWGLQQYVCPTQPFTGARLHHMEDQVPRRATAWATAGFTNAEIQKSNV